MYSLYQWFNIAYSTVGIWVLKKYSSNITTTKIEIFMGTNNYFRVDRAISKY